MKTTYIKKVVFMLFLLFNTFIYGQYHGGNADGFSTNTINNTSCSLPIQFYAFTGGSGSLSTVNSIANTTCGAPYQFFAYNGGSADGFAFETINAVSCANPDQFYAFFGGNGDGFSVETTNAVSCANPDQFYAFFGGNADGFSVGSTTAACPTDPPVADFTASATTICVGQTVTFTDTSTNSPSAWTWTFTGGTPNNSTTQNPEIVYNTPGSYAVTLLAANFNGNDAETKTAYIIVSGIPTVPTVTPASRCDAGTVTLNATASAGATLNWYAASTGGAILASGTSFTTPIINSTTTYYVEAQFGTCTSVRRAVIATVNATPTIVTTTPASRCGNGSVVLQATASSGSIQWFANAAGGTTLFTGPNYTTPSLTTTTSYFVQVSQNGCSSPRTEVAATINVTPTITGTTPAARCDSGTVTLLATASSGVISWFATATGGTALATGTSFTTPSLSVTTTYYVQAIIGTCTSPRTAVIATVNAVPTIINTTPGSVCDSGTVTLSAATNVGTISWFANLTGGTALATGNIFVTPNISSTTTYYAEAQNGTCTSARTAVTATINPSPTITSTTPTTICGGTFTISATASAGTLAWYNVPTGGIVQGTGNNFSLSNWGTTTTFYVQATDGSCQSERVPVVVTVNQTPFAQTAVGASRCGTGTLALSATYTNGIINWYDAPSGGNLVFTGSNFMTPSLSATTTYYVEGVNGICISAIRTPITATINAIPAVNSTTPASRCGAGIVMLSATSSAGSLSWYSAAIGGTALATGTSFSPNISSTTTYYVEASNGSCTSTRVAVIATIDASETITSTTPASRCDAGTLPLTAVATGGTLNWYAAATGGSPLATGSSFTTPSISSTTTYYVSVTNGTCTSVRVPVTATITSNTAITATTPASRCGNGTVTLQATASAGSTISWFANATGGTALATGGSFTTPNLSATTTYYVEASNGSCTSTRTAVVATINAVPVLTGTTPASRCGNGSVTLLATASSGIISWYANATGGTALATGGSFTTPSLSATTTYYVEAANGSCSTTRTAIIATINANAAITATTPASRCGNGTVTLQATASAGSTISWFANATGGTALATGGTFTTPSLSANTTYYVEASNGSCTSTRVAVIATIDATQSITSTTPASRCDVGTLTLTAAATSGTISWYATAAGGSVLATGSSFTTPSISATTTYYVSVTNGTCTSVRVPVTATITSNTAITATTPASRCGNGIVTLQASASAGSTISWFANATGGTALATGGTFTTPSLSTTTTYYVEASNGSCTSTRTAVVATINALPVLTGTTPASRCGNGSVTLLATASSGTISWYANLTGGIALATGGSFTTPSLSATTTYYVEAANGSCSTTRTAVIATINANAAITATTPASRCGNGIVTLQATASAGSTISWFANATGGTALATGGSFTTPNLSATTTYYVEASNGSCTSTRTAVVATINAVPVLTGTTPASRCGNGSVTLLATASSGIISWYANATGGTALATGGSFTTPSLSATTTYYVEAANGSCSTTREAVIATINANAAITATTPASRCGNGTVTLQATASAGSTITWYANATGGTALATGGSFTTPSLSATTTYYVEANNGSCTSTRIAVVGTINAVPVLTGTTPASRCGNGTVTLQATASSGTISWYANATGGTALATGGSFATPSLSATTTYYVEAANGTCSTARTAVIATINANATITATTPASRCGNGTVTLQATASAGSTITWYANATGGTALATGGSFTTPSLSGTTTYYVEANNGSCTSTRIAVVATITSTAAPTGNANQTFCAGETVGLIAVANGSDIIWYDAPTGGNVVSTSTAIISGATYYASQTLNGCESSIRLAVTMTLGNCLGTTDFIKLQMTVYPNPTKDFVIVNANQVIEKVELVNLLGQTLFAKPCSENEVKVYFDNLPTATYLLRVTSENNLVKTFKIIKQ